MSYKKACAWHSRHVKRKSQYMGFSVLAENERRAYPWLGSAWYEPGMDEERHKYIEEYEKETERLKRENPNLKIV